MPEQDIVSWSTMLSAYAQNGLLDEAKQTFGLMPQHNSTSSTAMLASYAQHKQLRESKVLFDNMLERDVVSWTAMLAAYAHNGHVRHSERLFESLPERDTICWSAMLAALVQNGLYLEAFVVFDEMKMAGSIDKVCFVSILIACSQGGKVSTAKSLFLSMSLDFGFQPSKQHYCCMIDVFGRAGHLENAQDLVANMPYVPDSIQWRCLFGASRSNNDAQHGASVAREIIGLEKEHSASYELFANLIRL
ncbi:pentatricopeptide repeat-containing protein At4g02750-like [Selaginella moellendorffii]|uniref:pentatricopeptide repeat-containing protein At4g02750-like n=1 Tax=Selaginella moellendorffii TaxID=88036 RepID=UPI000D1C2AEF|nr:pentatricopeptide repeat-containing protein At4g02750-like [Selaginella moellendorffii]XP_024523902.1 pentatricopeptide repeat-containing protein At4g02750-like [Selaginella moellendorffii]|eukprot:XP_024523901.1 pentatricopeptide repeat-containing protein At4g02750-like [Selaginella moellendorffii]